MSIRTLAVALLVLSLAGFSAPVWGQEGPALKKIRIGMPNRGVPNLGLMAAQRYGFFRAQGLDAELIVMRPSVSLQTLMAGDLDYSTVLASAARASVSGLPLRIIMASTVGQDFSLTAKPLRPGNGQQNRPELFRNIQQHPVGIGEYMFSYRASLQIFF